ncbi:ABC transporter ATP-binding protein [Clostridium septicum]|uniref:ABC-type quaternary amine transporter n=1 Tax=Clostridium septicum TaxID=1504 RepID=A0A9N7JIN0_CLOSE|nr:ABC transporter ATP-binding protein [Clostridium septicum]AYE33019.1 ABC transporter ATP-binding protein [Clostridium septicum]MDU1313412.1 ABC transporter ATP-binding protein [Clostridium septicum]QAS61188.1 ABC transporter ATP-binding protein [Clostridium septicum]UEC19464.1 ABC transporter ATP-binding protein [Clostridium septicum]USR99583.1 ABC transporter ATP-binding protein [Clostridium septicum]
MQVKIKDLSFKYDNSKDMIIDKFSLNIEKGEIVAILGASGCGKSTILRLIAGLEEPYSGEIILGNKIVVTDEKFVSPEDREVGMVFQDYALFPHLNVYENIKFGLHKISKKEQKEIVENMIKLVNLEGYENRYPYELSGGQQQRVALARALAPKPVIILMDEPFSNLDSHLRGKIREELKEIIKKSKTTCIFVTHDIEDVKAISDRVVKV